MLAAMSWAAVAGGRAMVAVVEEFTRESMVKLVFGWLRSVDSSTVHKLNRMSSKIFYLGLFCNSKGRWWRACSLLFVLRTATMPKMRFWSRWIRKITKTRK
jgi:hypothetical protein